LAAALLLLGALFAWQVTRHEAVPAPDVS